MAYGEIKGPLQSRLGQEANHTAPKGASERGAKAKRGRITDEFWADESINAKPPHPHGCNQGKDCWGDYSYFAQLIDWEDGTQEIRLGYYNRQCGPERGWRYGSQMTISHTPNQMKAFLEAVLNKRGWFAKIAETTP